MTQPPFFTAPPDTQLVQLPMEPRLASWNKASDPEQMHLLCYLQATEELLRRERQLEALLGRLTLRLEVGPPPSVDLLAEHDLDNYAFPLVSRLQRATNGHFVSVWCRKRHAASSYVGIVTARSAPLPRFDQLLEVTTTASGSTTAFKRQISNQVKTAGPLPLGPVKLHVGFRVGLQRNWMNLWKPTIDSLDRLLGRTCPDKEWHPLDGRITELGLHCQVEPKLGNTVYIAIGAGATGFESADR